ncbi:hypothetical protein OG705_35215 [Streptomyces sp. NBC_00838]|uniref:hypothetical protein n=1 Tax=Streptomyces sp. NBC_00838 TaxID=2903680 RepID=UPI003865B373|nr:hypothetical protein OG705_35215 [Streptomyces sp. NBC_00838]
MAEFSSRLIDGSWDSAFPRRPGPALSRIAATHLAALTARVPDSASLAVLDAKTSVHRASPPAHGVANTTVGTRFL